MGMEIYNESRVKARKPYKCHICGIDILPGEYYWRESGKWDGDFFDRKTCPVCYGARNDYLDGHEEEYSDWAVSDYVDGYICEKVYSTNPCADCKQEKPLLCPKIREYYENKQGGKK